MITGRDIFDVFAAIVPLYVAMILAYGSVRWWRIFTPDQCSGINRFVAVFAVPLLSFHFISTNNPYTMNYHFIAADSLQKLIVLAALSLWHRLGPRSHKRCAATLDWTITLFSLATLPNTLVMGIPLLRAMYGEFSASLMVQIVVLQSVVWYTLMLFLFEYRAAKALIADQFPPEIAGSIASFRVESDVVSLSAACNRPLLADADVGPDGRLHVVVRRSAAPSVAGSSCTTTTNNKKSLCLHSLASVMTPRQSNLTGVEIYSLQSSREPTPRGSSFNQSDFCAMFASAASGGGGLADEEVGVKFGRHKGAGIRSDDSFINPASYPPLNRAFACATSVGGKNSRNLPAAASVSSSSNANVRNSSKELHMYVWSASSTSPVSEANLRNAVNRAACTDLNVSPIRKGQVEMEDGVSKSPGIKFPLNVSSSYGAKTKIGDEGGLQVEGNQQMPPASVMTRLILIMVWRKLIRNPNTYSSLIGLIWSLVSFRWNIEMPTIIKGSIAILSDAGLGMAMFSLGLFMALQPKIIACGKSVAIFSMAVRFLTGPAVIVATSIAIGVRGVLLHVAIVQAALPQGIVPFVFAKEYNCHPDILSTAVIFGMLIALPITILYYVLLGV